jgi:hypothetical protein
MNKTFACAIAAISLRTRRRQRVHQGALVGGVAGLLSCLGCRATFDHGVNVFFVGSP